jgi:signal transduction histidine kinase
VAARVPAQDLLYQIWRADGTLLRHSESLSLTTPLVSLGQTGYATTDIQGKSYRTYATASPDGATILQVAEHIDNRNRLHLALLLTYLAALCLPLFLTWRASGVLLRRSLQFFNALAERVAKRDPQDAQPVQIDEPPREVVPMLNSVNGLVHRAASVISLEQRFTSVAAHELRAPLASIRAQAQLARDADTEQELQESLALVIRGVDHAARVFDQLLDLTRMEGLVFERATQFKPVDLQAVCHQVLAELQFQMQRKHLQLVDSTRAQLLDGVYFALYLIVRNLVANAMLYTPDHGTVAVGITVQDTQLLLQVDDSGKGIAPQDRQRVFERYSRLQQANNEGIGLGLFIVQQAVHLHQGQIVLLDSPYGGLRAQVSLPLLLRTGAAASH